ncbi:hypothetical protein [Chitinophaga defluvii]|uniref:O-antigen ligase-like membrane protein n=1 Tax=Chitinophaga defluvii TaxID=3163343 RepID=A0ABV2T6V7_9BACT
MFLFQVIISFLIIFNFPVPVVYNSAIVSFLLASIYYFLTKKNAVSYFSLKYNVHILIGLGIVILVSTFPPILHLTFDFGILKAFILQFSLLIILIYCLPILLGPLKDNTKSNFRTAAKLIVCIFVIQSIIQVLGFIFPPFADLIHFFQKESISRRDYGGIRALALSGNPFFDLSTGYAVCFLIYTKFIIDIDRTEIKIKNILFFLILIIGTFFAGRTGFIGLGLTLIAMILYLKPFTFKLFSFLKVLIISLLGVQVVLLLLPSNIRELLFDKLLPFAFEFLYSYLDQGSITTESTDILSEMYFPISVQTFFFGEGKYIGLNGSYYMYTDAGYMRHILYYGLIGQIILILYQMVFFLKPLGICIRSSFTTQRYNDCIFWGGLLVLLFVLHYKGEVIGFMPTVELMVLLIGVGYLKDERNNMSND